jgi:hypothetical protein
MWRLFNGLSHHNGLGIIINSVFLIGFTSILIEQGIHATCFVGGVVAVKGVTGKAYYLTGF